MIEKINIRPKTKEDYSFGYFVIKQTLKEYIKKTWGWNTEVQKNFYRQNSNKENQYIIELDGIKIGLLKYDEYIDKIVIDQIFILPKYQNKGIGSKVLTEVINIGKNKNIPIVLQVLKVNIKAKKLYEKFGFVEYEQTDTHIKMEKIINREVKMADIKAILFDYDGVMTLDKTGTESICNYISKITGIEKSFFESKYREFYPELFNSEISYEHIWGRLCQNIGVNIPIEILYDSFVNTPIDKEMHTLVKELRDKNYITALVTDNKTARIKTIKKHFNLDKYFNEIIVSDEVGSSKSTEAIFIKTLEKINLEPNECIFIDNHENNLIAPKKLGMITYYFDDKNRDIDKLKNYLYKKKH